LQLRDDVGEGEVDVVLESAFHRDCPGEVGDGRVPAVAQFDASSEQAAVDSNRGFRWVDDVAGGVADLAAAVFDFHEAVVAPVRAPGVLQDPAAVVPEAVVPADQGDAVVDAGRGVVVEDAAGVRAPGMVDGDSAGDRAVGVNRLFNGVGFRDPRADADELP